MNARRTTRRSPAALLRVAVLLALVSLWPQAGSTQDAVRIAAVVNDDAISLLDVIERTNLIFATTGLQDTQETRQRILPQVLRALIDEKLQLQEGARNGILPENIDLRGAYRVVEEHLGLASGQLESFLAHNRLSRAALDQQILAEIIWTELVDRRLRAVEVSEADIDDELARIQASADQPSYLLAEIFLAVDEPAREPEVEAAAMRLRDAILGGGASFQGLARQFSQSASAAEGGDLGWIVESQLPEELRATIASLRVGEISRPVRVAGGFALVLLRDQRIGFEAGPRDAVVRVRQLIVPRVADETAEAHRARAAELAMLIESCADYDTIAATRPGIAVGAAVTVQMRELHPDFFELLRDVPAGELAAPHTSEQGIHLAMVCERSDPVTLMPTRTEIRDQILNQQFDLISRGYLRDLRRAAFVDVRI